MNISMAKQILVIIRRSNGDVLLSSALLQQLHDYYAGAQIDLLINDNTLGVAKALPAVRRIYCYSYAWKTLPRWARMRQHVGLIRQLWRRYDLAISLTTTDSSVWYARLAGRQAISLIETEAHKNWWKQRLLDGYYYLDPTQHVILNHLKALNVLQIPQGKVITHIHYSAEALQRVQAKLHDQGIRTFLIFHPSAQYAYKIYPDTLRQALLHRLNDLGIALVVTGANTPLDLHIKTTLPNLENLYDFIGETNLDEYIALSHLASAYVGGDTLNMHIAAAQDKPIFAIFGPTLLPIWSPWNNALQCAATHSQAQQTYGNITIFQADMPCVPCGKAGCDNQNGNSECLSRINPATISAAVSHWLNHRHQENFHE